MECLPAVMPLWRALPSSRMRLVCRICSSEDSSFQQQAIRNGAENIGYHGLDKYSGSLLLMDPFGQGFMATALSGLFAAGSMVVLLASAGRLSAILFPLAAVVMAVLLKFLLPVVAEMFAALRLLVLAVAGCGTYFLAAVLFSAVPSTLRRR